MKSTHRASHGRAWIFVVIGLVVLSMFALFFMHGRDDTAAHRSSASTTLIVYCAAGIKLPVEQAAKEYEKEFGVNIELDYGSSGEMEGKLELDRSSNKTRADLYIPADVSFSKRTQQKGLTAESIHMAQFRLVVAVKSDAEHAWENMDQMLASKPNFVVCDQRAGVGKKTLKTLSKSGHWDQVDQTKKSSFPRVPEAANAIKTSNDIDAGFIWDTTAKQFGLKILDVAELESAVSTVTVNVVASSTQPTEALRFARYLTAQDKGQKSFKQFEFTPIGTDQWAQTPELTFYCGGVNRDAVLQTLREFEKREGIRVLEQFAGCGTLVGNIRTIQTGGGKAKGMPDAFLTCDATYMTKVQELFNTPIDISATQVVMLVRKGNPKRLKTLKDLAQPGLRIGTTNPRASTLGDLSQQLFATAGVADDIRRNNTLAVTSATAHELLVKMQGNDNLDVVLVYRANCQHLSDDFELVPIKLDRAVAVQNMAVQKSSPYPALAARLMEAVRSATSKQRFEKFGFEWRVAEVER